jgi:phosphate transport system permease protein
VLDVKATWARIATLPVDTATLVWVPNMEQLFGEVTASPLPDQPGVFRTTLDYAAPDSPAAKAGLRDGDVLLAANGQPLQGSQQAWQAIVVLARENEAPVQLTIERAGERQVVPFPVRREGEIPLARSLPAALWRFVCSLDEPRYPEHAGLASAILGSLYVVFVTILFSFPLGIAAAVYLEEYAKRSRLTTVLQVLIANLAGIPSVVYGIIGLEIVARALNLQQSVLAGGITLGLLILPVMILGCREALRTVPPWVRHAAAAVGATPSQVVWYQVLPYAMPGMLTAMILAVSRAIGEAAPLIMLGAFLYVTYLPSGLMDTFTVVPLQIFSWATRPQAGYETITAAAIVVLLVILLLLNGTAIVLRNRFQLRW